MKILQFVYQICVIDLPPFILFQIMNQPIEAKRIIANASGTTTATTVLFFSLLLSAVDPNNKKWKMLQNIDSLTN